MDLGRQIKRYFRVLRSWAWLILLGACLSGATNYYFITKAKPMYEASTTLMVGQTIRQTNPEQQEIALADQLATYYQELLKRQPVLDGVKQTLKLDLPLETLNSMLTTRVVPNTSFIELNITDSDPIRAVQIVNAFGDELINQSPTAPQNQQAEQRQFMQKQLDNLQTQIESGRKDLEILNQTLTGTGITAAEIADTRSKIKALQAQIDVWQSNYTNLLQNSNLSSPNSISVLEPSKQAREIKGVSPLITTAITVTLGILIAFGFAILLEYLDDRIKSHDDIQDRLNLPLLGHLDRKSIGPNTPKKLKKGESSAGRTAFDMEAMYSNQYELLCSNIRFSKTFNSNRKSLVITSPNVIKNQAKIARDLAVAMSSFEQSILVIDANNNNPELHNLLNIENHPGFYEVFYDGGGLNIAEAIQQTPISNLFLMTAGFDSSQGGKMILAGSGTQRIFELPQQSLPGEFVIFNCEGLLTDKTTRLLASQITATVLICELKRTRGRELKEAAEIVDRLNGNILGVVTIPHSKWSFNFGFRKKNGEKTPKKVANGKKKPSRNKESAGLDDSKVTTIPVKNYRSGPVDSANAADSSGDFIEINRVINLGPASSKVNNPVHEEPERVVTGVQTHKNLNPELTGIPEIRIPASAPLPEIIVIERPLPIKWEREKEPEKKPTRENEIVETPKPEFPSPPFGSQLTEPEEITVKLKKLAWITSDQNIEKPVKPEETKVKPGEVFVEAISTQNHVIGVPVTLAPEPIATNFPEDYGEPENPLTHNGKTVTSVLLDQEESYPELDMDRNNNIIEVKPIKKVAFEFDEDFFEVPKK